MFFRVITWTMPTDDEPVGGNVYLAGIRQPSGKMSYILTLEEADQVAAEAIEDGQGAEVEPILPSADDESLWDCYAGGYLPS